MGERKIIDSLWNDVGDRIDYDDCAYFPRGEIYELVTTDFVGEGTHFVEEVSPHVLGEFIAGVHLSDVAAMGGVADYFLLSAFMPGDTEYDFLRDLIKGLVKRLREYDVRYLGGDLKESKMAGFSGFAVGHVEKNKILRRIGAKIGEIIGVTGPLGKNAAAYYLWNMGMVEFDEVLKISPRMREGRVLAGRASVAMDTSDGIISSIAQLQVVNNLGFSIDFENLPVHPLAMEVVEDYDVSLTDLLNFGGEYELIYTSDKRILGYEIGEVVKSVLNYGGFGYESFSEALDKA